MHAHRCATYWVRLLPALLLCLALVAAGCGDDDSTTSTGATGDEPPDDAHVVVQITVGGGFVTATTAFSTVPQLTVLADGTVLSPGFTTLEYPGPAIVPIQAGTVTADVVDDLVEQARALGLLDGPLTFGQPAITDAPTTTVTIVDGSQTYRHDAYALAPAGTGDAVGVDGDAAANRAALAEFVAAAQAVATGDRLWAPVAVVATVIGPAVDEPLAPVPVEWPLPTPPATGGEFPCTFVEGDDAATLLASLAGAKETTGWIVGGETWSIAFRPLVPGDPGCG
jgi:hypothetical protein